MMFAATYPPRWLFRADSEQKHSRKRPELTGLCDPADILVSCERLNRLKLSDPLIERPCLAAQEPLPTAQTTPAKLVVTGIQLGSIQTIATRLSVY